MLYFEIVIICFKINRNEGELNYIGIVYGECYVFGFVEVLRYFFCFDFVYSIYYN